MDRVSTGIAGLDKFIDGGIPRGYTVLVFGKPGTGKSCFVEQFAFNMIMEDERVLLALTQDTPQGFLKRMELREMDIDAKGPLFAFIDVYNVRFRKGDINNFSDMGTLLYLIKRRTKNWKGGAIVIDTITDFLLYGDKESTLKFIDIFMSYVKEKNLVGLLTLEEGIHKDAIEERIKYVADGVIHTKIEGTKRLLRIEKMRGIKHPLDWIEFEIKDNSKIRIRELFK